MQTREVAGRRGDPGGLLMSERFDARSAAAQAVRTSFDMNVSVLDDEVRVTHPYPAHNGSAEGFST
jgi:hypothetical protein